MKPQQVKKAVFKDKQLFIKFKFKNINLYQFFKIIANEIPVYFQVSKIKASDKSDLYDVVAKNICRTPMSRTNVSINDLFKKDIIVVTDKDEINALKQKYFSVD